MSEEELLLEISNAVMRGQLKERERIIKLITTDGFEHCNKNLYNGGCDCRHIDDLLALIKGEQK